MSTRSLEEEKEEEEEVTVAAFVTVESPNLNFIRNNLRVDYSLLLWRAGG